MAQKRYTRERLEGIAADSAAKLKDAFPDGAMTCEYLHPDANTVIKGADVLKFLWKAQWGEYDNTYEMTA